MSENDNVKEMVERVEWMSPIHYEILMFFGEHDIWITPAALARNIEYNRSYVSRECNLLMESGVLENSGRSFRLSDIGRRFLEGDLDPDDLDEPDSDE